MRLAASRREGPSSRKGRKMRSTDLPARTKPRMSRGNTAGVKNDRPENLQTQARATRATPAKTVGQGSLQARRPFAGVEAVSAIAGLLLRNPRGTCKPGKGRLGPTAGKASRLFQNNRSDPVCVSDRGGFLARRGYLVDFPGELIRTDFLRSPGTICSFHLIRPGYGCLLDCEKCTIHSAFLHQTTQSFQTSNFLQAAQLAVDSPPVHSYDSGGMKESRTPNNGHTHTPGSSHRLGG